MMHARWRAFLSLMLGGILIVSLTSCRLGQRNQGGGGSAPPGSAPAGVVPAIDVPGVSGVVLFQDDFQDGRADEWTISSAWTVQQSGATYVFASNGYGGAWIPGGQNWSGYIFRAGVRVNSGSLSMSLDLTQGGRYVLLMREDGLFLMKEQPAGAYSLLAQTGAFAMNTGHAVAVASQSGHLQVYVDRVLWMDVMDGAPLANGTVGVAAQSGSQVAVDNVLVMRLSSALPGGTVQAPPPLASQPAPDVLAPPDGGGLPLADVQPEPIVDEPGPIQQEPPDHPPPDQPPSGGQPDLTVDRVTMQPNAPEQGQPMTVAVTVRNAGEGQAGAFNIRWYPEGATFVGCSWDVYGLPPGESVDMVCDYQGYPDVGTFNWGAIADADREVAESNENNNDQSGDITVTPRLMQEPPPAPTGCHVTGWSMTSVTIAWDFPGNQANISGFSIYQGVTSIEKWVGPPSRETTIGNLQAGVQYHFDVRAYNDAGESDADVCSVDVTPNP